MRSRPFLRRVWPPPDATTSELAVIEPRRLQALLFVSRFGPSELMPDHASHTLLRLALAPPESDSEFGEFERLNAQQACACALRHLIDTRATAVAARRAAPHAHAASSAGTSRRPSRANGAPRGTTPLPLALLAARAVIDHLADDGSMGGGGAPAAGVELPGFGLGIDTRDEGTVLFVMEQLSIATHLQAGM